MTNISDNTNFQSLKSKADSLELICDLLQGFNFDLEAEIIELSKNIKRLSSLPDKFNRIFSQHGWIATEDMPVPIMEKSINIFETEGIDKAKDYFCESFDDAYFALHNQRMQAIWVWKDTPRSRLLELAYIDHKQGRYHASVPVVLAQIDGLSFDTKKGSFFGNNLGLVIENSISAHGSGLRDLSDKMSKPKWKTSDKPIEFPFRNGIMHGRELAYDNVVVSTQCFFTLFAMRPWALKYQQVEYNRQMGNEDETIEGFRAGDRLSEIVKTLIKG